MDFPPPGQSRFLPTDPAELEFLAFEAMLAILAQAVYDLCEPYERLPKGRKDEVFRLASADGRAA